MEKDQISQNAPILLHQALNTRGDQNLKKIRLKREENLLLSIETRSNSTNTFLNKRNLFHHQHSMNMKK